jgi:hypothetical protein
LTALTGRSRYWVELRLAVRIGAATHLLEQFEGVYARRSVAFSHVIDSSPFFAIGPKRGGRFTLSDVLAMPRLEAGTLGLHAIRLTLFWLASGARALFAKANDFLFTIIARLDDMRLCRVVWGAARLVASHRVLIDPFAHFLPLAARKLSTMLGQGRPADLAIALADALRFGESSLLSPRSAGRFLSQIGFLDVIVHTDSPVLA